MDKYEYQIRLEEINSLIGKGQFGQAMEIADTIDWRRVRSVSTLCRISDLYKINRDFEKSRDILLMAYDRYPTGRSIVYSLCELAIRLGETVQAVEYYKEFVRLAPRDTGRYILQYKIYQAQDVSLEERIAVLEEFKKHDYREKWAYELAFLYHRVGLKTKCVEECDQMFLWFGDGKYVVKALDLKALHAPLSEKQKELYRKHGQTPGANAEPALAVEPAEPLGIEEPADGSVNTKRFSIGQGGETTYYGEIAQYAAPQQAVYPEYTESNTPAVPADGAFIPASSDDPYNAAPMEEAPAESGYAPAAETLPDSDPSVGQPMLSQAFVPSVNTSPEDAPPLLRAETRSLPDVSAWAESSPMSDTREYVVPSPDDVLVPPPDIENPYNTMNLEETLAENMKDVWPQQPAEPLPPLFDTEQEERPGTVIRPSLRYQNINHFDNMLGQDYDGQMSLLVPENTRQEEQVQGQISIADIMNRIRRTQQANQARSVRERVKDETGDMFISFDEKTRADLHAHIERVVADALRKEREEKDAPTEAVYSVQKANVITPDETAQPYVLAERMKAAEAAAGDDADSGNAGADNADLAADLNRPAVFTADTAEGDDIAEDAAHITSETGSTNDVDAAAEDAAHAASDTDSADDAAAAEDIDRTASEADGADDDGAAENAAHTASETGSADDAAAAKNAAHAASEMSSADGDSAAEDAGRAAAETNASGDGSENEAVSDAAQDASDAVAHAAEKDSAESDAQSDEAPKKPSDAEDEAAKDRIRKMTPEEKKLFGMYIHRRSSRAQIVYAIDHIRLEADKGNVIISGTEGPGAVNFAKGLIRSVQLSNDALSGKVAKISGDALQPDGLNEIFEKLAHGALIIENPFRMSKAVVPALLEGLQAKDRHILILLVDSKKHVTSLLRKHPDIGDHFDVRVDIEAVDDDTLVAYAKQYALENEYVIDNLGALALHSRINELQTIDHEVTIAEVREIVDEAIDHANRHSVGHFFDTLLHKRYDKEDMIILRENDFIKN